MVGIPRNSGEGVDIHLESSTNSVFPSHNIFNSLSKFEAEGLTICCQISTGTLATMTLFKSFLVLSTICCLLQCPPELQASHMSKTNDSLPKPSEHFDRCGLMSRRFATTDVHSKNSSIGDWSWMAALNYGSSENGVSNFKCTATLISKQWLITAAHCVQDIPDHKKASVLLGTVDRDRQMNISTSVEAPVNQIVIHPQYSSNPVLNDIALIQLNSSIQYTVNIRPACLLSGARYKEDEYYWKKKPYIVGWGVVDGLTNSTKLQYSSLRMVKQPKCEQEYVTEKAAIINDKVICAGEPGKDNCQRDPTGALFFVNHDYARLELGGISSFGVDPQCSSNHPGVYTKIALFIDWINLMTGENF